ncbi:MAG TPA: Ig-like domain repeat protein [Candidatus Acidoferrales bacterium]|nr:Ig-like domain repeat protein [Candidatus Acidoferrales bacterium]
MRRAVIGSLAIAFLTIVTMGGAIGPAPAYADVASPGSDGLAPGVPSTPGPSLTPTSIYLASVPDLGLSGYGMTWRVFVTPAPGSGTVDLEVDGTVVTTVTLTAGQIDVYLNWTPTELGAHVGQAVFSGNETYASTTSDPHPFTVWGRWPSSVTVVGNPNPVVRNDTAVFTATVSPNPGSGSVEWRVDGVVVATTTVSGAGTTTYSASFPSVAQHGVQAWFLGTPDYQIGPWRSDGYVENVIGDPVGLSLTLPSDPVPAGDVVVSAVLSPNPGGGTLSWSWVDYLPGTDLPVDPSGTTHIDLGTLTAGPRTLYVRFGGYDQVGPTSAQLAFQVWDSTVTAVTSDRSSAYQGELPVKLTATVATPSVPAGSSVTFLDDVGGVVIQLGPATVDPYSLTASLSTTTLRVGTHTIRARYGGGPWILPSTSAPITVTVLADTAVHATFAPSLTTFYGYKDGYRDTVRLGGVLSERATVTIRIYNSYGTLKRTFSLGWRNAGAYYADWGGKTASGVALPAGKYKVVASLKDVLGHARTFTGYTTLSWRRVTWKSVSVLRYADTGAYYVGVGGGAIYLSGDYSHGIILDSGSMIRDCTGCGWAGGRFVFTVVSTGALAYRYLSLEIRGHGFIDREHPGSLSLIVPSTGQIGLTTAPCMYDITGQGCGLGSFPTSYIDATHHVTAWVWETQAWGDAYDLRYLKLTYQYAVWA